jgi:predicted transposase/invertase (TIGR01784 family)
MTPLTILDLARHFPENGMKLLLQRSDNLRDVLHFAHAPLLGDLNFKGLEIDPTHFVQPDYRHVESDLVLRLPLKGRRRALIIYILLEHQSESDPFMLFRTLQYIVAILATQQRQWRERHNSLEGFRFQPVLPIVFYTGTAAWPNLGQFTDLFTDVPEIAEYLPAIKPMFIPLRDTAATVLKQEGGAFGQILRLFQAREAQQDTFSVLLDEAVAELEKLPKSERVRWQELMSYLHALVYHVRSPNEHAELFARIEHAVRSERRRKETAEMKETIADMLRAEGRAEGRKEGAKLEGIRLRRQVLLRTLRGRFGEPNRKTIAAIENCESLERLDEWFEKTWTAQSLDEVGISSKK